MSAKHQPVPEPAEEAPPLEVLADVLDRLLTGWIDDVPSQIFRMRSHQVTQRGLIDQLYESLTDETRAGEESTARSIPDSRPPVPDPPFDVLLAIRRFEESAPAKLVDLAPWASSQPRHVVDRLARDLLKLERRAEIALGHHFEPRRLRGTCPVCDRAGTLVANRDREGRPTDAFCSAASCDAKWDASQLGLLGRILQDQDRAGVERLQTEHGNAGDEADS